MFKPRLLLRVVWNNEFAGGKELAHQLYSRLCRDAEHPASRGIGLPVYFHTGATPAEARLPEALELDAAQGTVIIALIDTSIRASEEWKGCIRDIEQRVSAAGKKDLFLPVACEDKVHKVVNKANLIPLDRVKPKEARPEKLVALVTHELARLLLQKGESVQTEDFGLLEKSYAPVKLFLSHSKHDGEGMIIATELRDYGRKHFPVATFYDSNDIAPGHNFEKEISANVADSAMVVIHTDTYSDRSWCRKEVLTAKLYGCPVLIVNAVTKGEDRHFPYLGNAPSIRWPFGAENRCEVVIETALREVLRNAYFIEHVRALKSAGLLPATCVEIGTAPEMLTYRNLLRAKKCDRSKPSVLLYPDPPLGDEEIDVLDDLNPDKIVFTTPTAIAAQPDPRAAGIPLKGRIIGLSISNSPDLPERGMSLEHLEDATVECARYLLAQGASLAYGGDLRPGGFTTILFELVRSHNRAGSAERIHNFLAWPIHLRIDTGLWNEYLDEFRSYKIAPPADLGVDAVNYLAPDDAAGRYAWARSLTVMREEMDQKIDARVLLGGQVRGFKGKYPGLLEEALLALRSNKPVYLIGGFGGCTRLIVDAIRGGAPEAFTEAFQQRQDPLHESLAARYLDANAQGRATAIDYAGELEYLRQRGVGGLNNGLSEAENEVLFVSRSLPEIVYFLLKGLTQRFT